MDQNFYSLKFKLELNTLLTDDWFTVFLSQLLSSSPPAPPYHPLQLIDVFEKVTPKAKITRSQASSF